MDLIRIKSWICKEKGKKNKKKEKELFLQQAGEQQKKNAGAPCNHPPPLSIGPGKEWQFLQDLLQAVILWSWMFCHRFWMIIGSKINTPQCPCRKSPVVSSSRVITHQSIPHFLERARMAWTPTHSEHLIHSTGQSIQVRIFPRSHEDLGAWLALLLSESHPLHWWVI